MSKIVATNEDKDSIRKLLTKQKTELEALLKEKPENRNRIFLEDYVVVKNNLVVGYLCKTYDLDTKRIERDARRCYNR